MLEFARKALADFNQLPPDEQTRFLIASGAIQAQPEKPVEGEPEKQPSLPKN
jgi:hypothetical protein